MSLQLPNPNPSGDQWRAVSGSATPADSIRAPNYQERARKLFRPVPITELGPSAPPPWIWPGYLARGHSTLLTGLWKAGKSTLVCHLLRDLQRGGGLVPEPLDAPVAVLTEEGQAIWTTRRDELELDSRLLIHIRPFKTRPARSEWEDFIGEAADAVRTDGIGLVVFDTLAALWPVADENDAPQVLAALSPLHAITEAGAALLLLFHPRKGDAGEAQATRGSGALPGFVDTIVELRRFAAENAHDRRRVLRAYGRFEDTKPEAVLELRPGGYAVVGDKAHVRREDRWQIITGILPDSGDGWAAEQVIAAWPAGDIGPGLRQVQNDLKAGAAKDAWTRTGAGTKGSPYRYRLPVVFDSRTPPVIEARNECGPAPPNSGG